jgi:hypothetical protein
MAPFFPLVHYKKITSIVNDKAVNIKIEKTRPLNRDLGTILIH